MLNPRSLIFSLKTRNFDHLVAFYRNLLGRPQVAEDDFADFRLGPHRLVIWRSDDPTHNTMPTLQLCFEVEDLDATRKWIQAYSIPSAIMESSAGRECFIEDPDDNPILLFQPSPQPMP